MLFECCANFLTCDRWRDYYGCRFLVSDNGMGMSADFKDTIFDVFTRAESSLTNKIQETGLGMAITRNLVEAMQHSLAAGMNAHVSKPVEMKVLEKTIRNIKSSGGTEPQVTEQ
jgi:K+-sensing histidine kinase KdpD